MTKISFLLCFLEICLRCPCISYSSTLLPYNHLVPMFVFRLVFLSYLLHMYHMYHNSRLSEWGGAWRTLVSQEFGLVACHRWGVSMCVWTERVNAQTHRHGQWMLVCVRWGMADSSFRRMRLSVRACHGWVVWVCVCERVEWMHRHTDTVTLTSHQTNPQGMRQFDNASYVVQRAWSTPTWVPDETISGFSPASRWEEETCRIICLPWSTLALSLVPGRRGWPDWTTNQVCRPSDYRPIELRWDSTN